MKISRSGVERLLAVLTDQLIPLTCEECRARIPELVDMLAAREPLSEELRPVMAHVDQCPECEALVGELLDDIVIAMKEAEPLPARIPDLSFLLQSTLPQRDIWRAKLDAVWDVIQDAAGKLRSIEINLKMPQTLPPLPAPGVLAEEDQSEKLVFSRTLTADYGIQIEIRARREPEATECNLLVEVDSPQPGVPRPCQVVLKSGQFAWKEPFDPVGQARIAKFPVALLTDLGISLLFED
ncbi:MAG: zf-HC2 domain-containing protein [Anaerolineales bacterium]|nr:zf-HC2 domain-containing protein [Anaerolineales bacterium]